MSMPSRRTLVIAALAIAAAAGAYGYHRYSTSQLQALRDTVAALVKDSSARVRDALGMETAPTTADRARFVTRLEEHAVTAEYNHLQLKRLEVARDRALTDAANEYLQATRELLKQALESHRQRRLLAESLRALAKQPAASDSAPELEAASAKLREQARRNLRAYESAVAAYLKLLDGFPARLAGIEAHAAKPPIEAGLPAEAARRLREEARQLAEEAERIMQSAPAR
jgi:hypothetical protein